MRINLSFLYRKKKYDASSVETTNLHRVLNLSDLSALGIASTLGPGVYVLIGNIIAKYTGPSIVLSFLIAGVCSFLAGLCYAELGSRVPRSGSAYIYIYVTIGEFLAFFIGWNVILEYIIGTSAGASALSQYIDALSDYQISKAMRAAMPMNLPGIAPYPDFLAFGMLLIIIFMLILGVKDSSMLNIIFTGANLAIVVFIVIVGTIESDPGNWFLDVYPNMSYTDMMGQNTTCAISNRCGSGGFTPFGAEGVIKGAAKCFYAYIGFDVIATSGEEVLDPKRTIPLSIVTTLIVVSLCYVLVSTTVSLMLPYYVYDPSSPLSEAFRYVGFQWASYVISVGAIISLATSLYAAMFPMPRVVYAMASDGLLFRQLDYVTPLFKTPLFACILTGLLSALLVLIFDLNQLVDMMSFGTLLAYSLVSVCTLILRYRPHEDYSHTVTVSQIGNGVATTETASNGSSETQQETQQEVVKKTWIGSIFGHSNEPLWKRIFMPTSIKPTKATSKLVNALTFIEVIDILVICAITNLGNLGYATAFAFFIIFLIIFVIIAFLIWLQPTDDKITTFKVPLVPFFPLCSAFINIFLMTSLNSATWIRFLVWFAIGFFVYFGYGIRYSHENKQGPHQNWLCPCFEKSYTTMEDTESVIPNSNIINDNESTV